MEPDLFIAKNVMGSIDLPENIEGIVFKITRL